MLQGRNKPYVIPWMRKLPFKVCLLHDGVQTFMTLLYFDILLVTLEPHTVVEACRHLSWPFLGGIQRLPPQGLHVLFSSSCTCIQAWITHRKRNNKSWKRFLCVYENFRIRKINNIDRWFILGFLKICLHKKQYQGSVGWRALLVIAFFLMHMKRNCLCYGLFLGFCHITDECPNRTRFQLLESRWYHRGLRLHLHRPDQRALWKSDFNCRFDSESEI